MVQQRHSVGDFDLQIIKKLGNHFFTLFTLCILSLLYVMSLNLNASAQTPRHTESRKTIIDATAITYFAVEHDTLSSIAIQFTNKVSNWKAIGKINHIQNDRTIPIGTAIKIPEDLLPDVPSTATVVAIAGVVTVTDKKEGEDKSIDNSKPLSIGSIILEGSQITTSKNGFITFALPDESRVSIPSNSQVRMTKLRMRQFTKSPRTEITLTQGRIESKVTPMTNNKGRFEVTSPLSTAGVRGTHFRVSLVDNGTANEVLSGKVEVSKTKNTNTAIKFTKSNQANNSTKATKATKANEAISSLMLTKGKGNIISQAGTGDAVDLLSPPSIETGFQLQERLTLQFHIAPQARASNYRAQISNDAIGQDIIAESISQNTLIKFTDIDDGNYFIKVTAIDHQGLEGLPAIYPFIIKAHPEPPFMLQPKKKVRGETVAFHWTEVANATSYRLQVARDTDFKKIVIDQDNITDSQFSSNQLPLGDYFWRIATIKTNETIKTIETIANPQKIPDQGPFSIPEFFQILAVQTMNPVNNTDGKTLEFSWTAEPLQQFLVQISEDTDFKKMFLTKETKEAKLTIPRPTPGTYYIRVRATDDDGFVGGFSNAQKFDIYQQWSTGSGDVLHSSAGAVRPTQ